MRCPHGRQYHRHFDFYSEYSGKIPLFTNVKGQDFVSSWSIFANKVSIRPGISCLFPPLPIQPLSRNRQHGRHFVNFPDCLFVDVFMKLKQNFIAYKCKWE